MLCTSTILDNSYFNSFWSIQKKLSKLLFTLVTLGGHDKLQVLLLPQVWLKVYWKYRTEDLHLARSLTIDQLQAFVTYLLLDQQKLLSYNQTITQRKINYVCNSQNQMFSAMNLRVKMISFLASQLLFSSLSNKHRKNCECCPGHSLTVSQPSKSLSL